ncbi:lipid II-degrading bacteriocin [Pseudomonas sp. BIGb0427]|uniref:lipid II-degrading bacteriocin n=1 Tax=unclassified Pseudomonas TaxID=196821 RepID=UPI0009E400E6|nr:MULTISPECIES: lipid II-degrading bacteriocin [unclassified Pseudomonas]QPG64932.1 lipid II-degrading bacteriocin [Pseudomonas sp. BIGb0427]
MQIELAPTIVYPDDYGTPTSKGGQTPPGHPLVIARMWSQRNEAYLSGNWWSMLCLDLKRAQYNKPPFSPGLMTLDLICAHHADQLKALDPTLENKVAWHKGRIRANTYGADKSPSLTTEVQFSGGIFTATKAIAHAIYGKGAKATVSLKDIGISPSVEKIPELKSLIEAAEIGSTQIDINVPYYTGQDSFAARTYLGNITLRIIGTITRDSEGNVSFSGQAKAYNDLYDAEASDHRIPLDESATTALRSMFKVTNAVSYEIEMPGSLPINYSTTP